MFESGSECQEVLPYSGERVFHALTAVMGAAGFAIASHDPVDRRITAQTRMSAWSWGEAVTVQVRDLSDGTAELDMRSVPLVGLNTTARFKHPRNARRLVGATTYFLQHATPDVSRAVAAAPSMRTPISVWLGIGLVSGGVILALYAGAVAR